MLMPIKKCTWRHCSFSLSCMWTGRLMNYLRPTVCKFPFLIATLIVCNTPSSMQMVKAFLWQPTMDKFKVNAWSTTNEVATIKLESLLTQAQYKAKGVVLFPCHVNCKTQLLYYAQPLEQFQLLQYSKLQTAKTVVEAFYSSAQYLYPSWKPVLDWQIQSTSWWSLQTKCTGVGKFITWSQ